MEMAATDERTTQVSQDLAPPESAYVREADRIEAIDGPFGEVMLEAAALEPGDEVLDVGCGLGTTTQEAAHRVAPGGTAVGVDIDASMLVHARTRAAGVANVVFLEGDAQTYPFEIATVDALISRFGTMFFGDPEAAFANLGRAVRPGGRLAIVCPLRSDWVDVAVMAAVPHVGPPDLGSPDGPGPFAFADGKRLHGVIRAGGFHEITLDEITREVRIGDDAEDVAGFITSLPEAQLLFEGKPEENVAAAVEALREGFAPFSSPDGVVVSESAWLATARR
jgi:SAM-dependent methyltransferase